MPNITKPLLRDEAFEYKKHLENKWNQLYDGSFSSYMEKCSSQYNTIKDFVEFIIERNFKK